MDPEIRPFQSSDEEAVIQLWKDCNLVVPWNDPSRDIQRKLTVQPELFLVGVVSGRIVATAMAGYNGHRGGVNYLAVHPSMQHGGIGTRIMAEVEQRLLAMGCPKINLQVRTSNSNVIRFYEKNGYKLDDVVNLGKRLISDDV